jgi:hypothetical protein
MEETMITSEEEAKRKKCCSGGVVSDGYCIASRCMAWNFWVPPIGATLVMEHKKYGIPNDSDKLGYCGLTKIKGG